MKHLLAAAVLAGLGALSTSAPAHASCQYLGTNYPVQYDCTVNQPWLPYGTIGNPPLSGPNPATTCSQPAHQHDMACTG